MLNLIPKTKISEEEWQSRRFAKLERIRKAEEVSYQKSFGRIPTREERDDWFRPAVTGPAMNHGGAR